MNSRLKVSGQYYRNVLLDRNFLKDIKQFCFFYVFQQDKLWTRLPKNWPVDQNHQWLAKNWLFFNKKLGVVTTGFMTSTSFHITTSKEYSTYSQIWFSFFALVFLELHVLKILFKNIEFWKKEMGCFLSEHCSTCVVISHTAQFSYL